MEGRDFLVEGAFGNDQTDNRKKVQLIDETALLLLPLSQLVLQLAMRILKKEEPEQEDSEMIKHNRIFKQASSNEGINGNLKVLKQPIMAWLEEQMDMDPAANLVSESQQI
ncbi:uncharacterized protein LOC132804087 [Ziziphus jujuba]|uniref:Uncharacterized protein LOC132804087 n=1 Tax=Ziziphus jujuba TaxID=326968 RepID=A0ABM4AB74_ZIZJJ|nr:uncharacterized protein LOC132804087 [Ziziphus jujuba]